MDEVISKETLRLAKGAAALDVLCLVISGLLGYPVKPMALGLLFGTLFLLLHFQLIGLAVKRSLSSSSPETVIFSAELSSGWESAPQRSMSLAWWFHCFIPR